MWLETVILKASGDQELLNELWVRHFKFRSRPESFISLESDITSEHDKSENIEVEVRNIIRMFCFNIHFQDNFGPNSSTPLKDSTPTNDVLGEHLCNINEEEMIQVEEPQVVHIGEIVEEKDIVESSDC